MNQPQQITLAIIAGSASSEHDISLRSAQSIVSTLKASHMPVVTLYLDKSNHLLLIESNDYRVLAPHTSVTFKKETTNQYSIYDTAGKKLHKIDLVFPVLHGQYGEDGAIQGYLEILGIPYIGSGITASAIAMDKELTKVYLESLGVPTVPHRIAYHDVTPPSYDALVKTMKSSIFFVKPARSGSSIGVSKVSDQSDLTIALQEAFQYDRKILIEPALTVRELEIAILEEKDAIQASLAGEIVCKQGFYDYTQKYDANSFAELYIPTQLDDATLHKIQNYAIKAHQGLHCRHLSRVDFFLTSDQQIYINEINTLPGFTSQSMYPLLWQHAGLSIADLVSKWIKSIL
ncbi:D-alanine--D-alanine ligase [Entomospira entomophila]|uniref:D-alanine--D-alanine ligase n=1 Tax=Entomospira entomophila TaxID=2719988 RepID=A0A968GAL5_9SPIO|nr:D-alanine--D-alanine ligase family protein [Entomospira entomophilus]NIZ40987.1 D-alanine--D-alanine ligase [Entomospira entomophilus]WDI35200.1 D-alanine--D-alanine ligase [Entomospira entomophilus]